MKRTIFLIMLLLSGYTFSTEKMDNKGLTIINDHTKWIEVFYEPRRERNIHKVICSQKLLVLPRQLFTPMISVVIDGFQPLYNLQISNVKKPLVINSAQDGKIIITQKKKQIAVMEALMRSNTAVKSSTDESCCCFQ